MGVSYGRGTPLGPPRDGEVNSFIWKATRGQEGDGEGGEEGEGLPRERRLQAAHPDAPPLAFSASAAAFLDALSTARCRGRGVQGFNRGQYL